MQDYKKKRLRQIRYLKKKKMKGFYYLQTWIQAEKLIAKELHLVLSELSSEAIKQLVKQYSREPVNQTTDNHTDNDKTIKYSNNNKKILDAIKKEIRKNHNISQSQLSEVLFAKYHLCSFRRVDKKPSKIRSSNLSKYIKKLKLQVAN